MTLVAEKPNHEYSVTSYSGSCREEWPHPRGASRSAAGDGVYLNMARRGPGQGVLSSLEGEAESGPDSRPRVTLCLPRDRPPSPQMSSRETSSSGSRSRRPSSTPGRRTPTPSSASCPPTSRLWQPRCGGAEGWTGGTCPAGCLCAMSCEMPPGSHLPWTGLPLSPPLSMPSPLL